MLYVRLSWLRSVTSHIVNSCIAHHIISTEQIKQLHSIWNNQQFWLLTVSDNDGDELSDKSVTSRSRWPAASWTTNGCRQHPT